MESFPRGEVGAGLGTEAFDVVVQSAFHVKESSLIGLVLDLVPMIPLIPGEVVELDEETLGPAFAQFLAVVLVAMALLELSPRGGEKAFQQILPANGGLRGGGTVDFILLEVGEGKSAVTPPVEVDEEGLLDAGMGVGFLKAGRQLADTFIPHFIGTFQLAVHRSTWAVSSGTRHRGHLSSSWHFHLTRVFPMPQLEEACSAIQRRRAGCKACMPAAQVSQSIADPASKEKCLCQIQQSWVMGS